MALLSRKKLFPHTREYLTKHKRRISPALFFSGFVFDLFTLNRVDTLFDNFILLGHLVVITLSIIFIHLGKRDQVFSSFTERLILFAPFTLVFSFGGVLSGFVIFYTKSASIFSNWPFLLILYILFISSEILFSKYQQTMFQVGMWFAATLSFTIFFIPVITKNVGPWTFLLSNIISVFVGWIFIHMLIKAYEPIRRRLAMVKTMFVMISLAFIAAYFLNIIPPIPLSMNESGIYHLVSRDAAGTLTARAEPRGFFEKFLPETDISITPGSQVYGYTAVFSPAGINTTLQHVWEYKEKGGRWKEFSRSTFAVNGGRLGGFRWYSFVSPFEGEWRIRTLSIYGQEIGQTPFTVTFVNQVPPLELIEL
jgi:hypothetical protein